MSRLQSAGYNPKATPRQLPVSKAQNVNYQHHGKYQQSGFQSVMHTTSAEERCQVTKEEPPAHLKVPDVSLKTARKLSLRFQA